MADATGIEWTEVAAALKRLDEWAAEEPAREFKLWRQPTPDGDEYPTLWTAFLECEDAASFTSTSLDPLAPLKQVRLEAIEYEAKEQRLMKDDREGFGEEVSRG